MAVTVTGPPGAARLAPPLRTLVNVALALERARPGEIAIVLADDATLRALNRTWRGIDRATDVLSFGYDDGAGPAPTARTRSARSVSGDLILSEQRWHEQARRYRVSRARELARLVIHGALHLSGLDHHRPAERRHMRAREEAALRKGAVAIRALERVLAR